MLGGGSANSRNQGLGAEPNCPVSSFPEAPAGPKRRTFASVDPGKCDIIAWQAVPEGAP